MGKDIPAMVEATIEDSAWPWRMESEGSEAISVYYPYKMEKNHLIHHSGW